MEILKIDEVRKYITFEEKISEYFLDDVVSCIEQFGEQNIFEDGIYITIEEFISGIDRFLDHAISLDSFLDWLHLACIVSYPSSFHYGFGVFCRREFNDLVDFLISSIPDDEENEDYLREDLESFKEDLLMELDPIIMRHYQFAYPLSRNIKEVISYSDDAFDSDDLFELRTAIDKLSELDYGKASYYKGFLKYLGIKGERKNYKEALSHFIDAIDNGCFEPLSYAGRILYEGLGVEPDYKKAINYFTKATILDDDIYSKVMISRAYFEGKGVIKDKNFALFSLEKLESIYSSEIDDRRYDINYEAIAYYFVNFARRLKTHNFTKNRLIITILRGLYTASYHKDKHFNVYGVDDLIPLLEHELSFFSIRDINESKHNVFYLYITSNDVRNLVVGENYNVELEDESGTFIGKFIERSGDLYSPILKFEILEVLYDVKDAAKKLEEGDIFEISYIHPAVNITLEDSIDESYKVA